jgi:hypothetical protein
MKLKASLLLVLLATAMVCGEKKDDPPAKSHTVRFVLRRVCRLDVSECVVSDVACMSVVISGCEWTELYAVCVFACVCAVCVSALCGVN